MTGTRIPFVPAAFFTLTHHRLLHVRWVNIKGEHHKSWYLRSKPQHPIQRGSFEGHPSEGLVAETANPIAQHTDAHQPAEPESNHGIPKLRTSKLAAERILRTGTSLEERNRAHFEHIAPPSPRTEPRSARSRSRLRKTRDKELQIEVVRDI